MFDAKSFLTTVTARPGIYRMLDHQGQVLYVGKAKNLKNRLTNYFRQQSDIRIHFLVQQIRAIDVTITHNEKEALLLENELIKSLKPRYNIVLKDDKSYPYLFLSEHTFPRLVFHRGPKKQKGIYYGPYPSAYAVKETLSLLQKLFKIRQCDDTFFKNRSRPCLQYQIKRCTAPCCDYITPEDYVVDVHHAKMFLEGSHQKIMEELVNTMERASRELAFEKAAIYRDQITSLRKIIESQAIYGKEGDVDVIAMESSGEQIVIYLLFIRQGKMSGSKTFFPKNSKILVDSELLRTVLCQYYLSAPSNYLWPAKIVLNKELPENSLIAEIFSEKAQKKIRIVYKVRGQKKKWQKLAQENAKLALKQRIGSKRIFFKRLQALKEVLGLQELQHIECFDISHSGGEATVASCVVFDEEGPNKSLYRQYNIQEGGGDDYKAMREVLIRRYKKAKEENAKLPDLMIIDGGKGQLSTALSALKECQILDVMVMGVAKGENRKPGLETLFIATSANGEEMGVVTLPPTSEALHYIQHIRDEAHRFAISRHRNKISKKRVSSPLENIPGIGPKRRQQLLMHFGGKQGLMGASEEAISAVPGINKKLAQLIYQSLHES